MSNKTLKEVLSNENFSVTTTNGKLFTPEDTARLFAHIYKRFGFQLDATCYAIGRLLQSSPLESQIAAELIAAGMAVQAYQNSDEYNMCDCATCSEDRDMNIQARFETYIRSIPRFDGVSYNAN